MHKETEVVIQVKKKDYKTIKHKIGNWYKHEDGELYILANVHARAVLIEIVSGCYCSDPIEFSVPLDQDVGNHCFNEVCMGRADEFTLVENITITES